MWDSSYDLKYVISAYIINLYIWIGVCVGFPYLMLMLWLQVGMWVCDTLFSCRASEYNFVCKGVYSSFCTGIWDLFSALLPYMVCCLGLRYWCYSYISKKISGSTTASSLTGPYHFSEECVVTSNSPYPRRTVGVQF